MRRESTETPKQTADPTAPQYWNNIEWTPELRQQVEILYEQQSLQLQQLQQQHFLERQQLQQQIFQQQQHRQRKKIMHYASAFRGQQYPHATQTQSQPYVSSSRTSLSLPRLQFQSRSVPLPSPNYPRPSSSSSSPSSSSAQSILPFTTQLHEPATNSTMPGFTWVSTTYAHEQANTRNTTPPEETVTAVEVSQPASESAKRDSVNAMEINQPDQEPANGAASAMEVSPPSPRKEPTQRTATVVEVESVSQAEVFDLTQPAPAPAPAAPAPAEVPTTAGVPDTSQRTSMPGDSATVQTSQVASAPPGEEASPPKKASVRTPGPRTRKRTGIFLLGTEVTVSKEMASSDPMFWVELSYVCFTLFPLQVELSTKDVFTAISDIIRNYSPPRTPSQQGALAAFSGLEKMNSADQVSHRAFLCKLFPWFKKNPNDSWRELMCPSPKKAFQMVGLNRKEVVSILQKASSIDGATAVVVRRVDVDLGRKRGILCLFRRMSLRIAAKKLVIASQRVKAKAKVKAKGTVKKEK